MELIISSRCEYVTIMYKLGKTTNNELQIVWNVRAIHSISIRCLNVHIVEVILIRP
jgi:hypothetical protein